MNDLAYLIFFSKRHNDDFLTALHSMTINVIRSSEAIGETDESTLIEMVIQWVGESFPEDEDIEKYAAAMVKTHSVASKVRNIHREVACTKYGTTMPDNDQIASVRNMPGRYGVEDETTGSWDEYYYNIAVQAARNSKCFSRKIGAILVKDKAVISTGYNGPPRGIPTCDNRWLIDKDFYDKYKPEKLKAPEDFEAVENTCPRHVLGAKSGELIDICVAAHAEENSILSCAREGISTKGAIMYMTCSVPCCNCMIKIINAGVSELVMTGTAVYDDNSMYLLSNSDVKVRLYDFC